MMDKTIKKKWVETLRSGRFKQGKKALGKTTGEFCCLGVLCELAVEAGVIEEPRVYTGVLSDDQISGSVLLYGEGQAPSILPNEVVRRAKLYSANPDILFRERSLTSLATLNDEGLTFNEIADIIEENL